MGDLLGAIYLRNFKAFADEHVIQLAPITLIFGANSAGKSSILQSLYLLQNSLEHSGGVGGACLRFSDHSALCDLGNYGEAISNHDRSRSMGFGLALGDVPFGLRWNFSQRDAAQDSTVDHGIDGLALCTDRFDREIWAATPRDTPFAGMRGESAWQARLRDPDWLRQRLKESDLKVEARLNPLLRRAERLLKAASRTSVPNDRLASLERARDACETAVEPKGLGASDAIERHVDLIRALVDVEEIRQPRGLRLPLLFSLESGADLHTGVDPTALFLGVQRRISALLERAHFMGPVRNSPRRIYTLEIGGNQKRDSYLGADVPRRLHFSKDLREDVNQWLAHLGIPYRIETVGLPERDPIALQIRLRRTAGADGPSAREPVAITDVGYGLSQLLPIVVNCIAMSDTLITIEQPELHIHPALQAQLGDLLVESATKGRSGREPPHAKAAKSTAKGGGPNQLIIETHSEHLILRFLKKVRNRELSPDQLRVVYVDSNPEGPFVHHIPVNESGEFTEPWPNGFFGERLAELVD